MSSATGQWRRMARRQDPSPAAFAEERCDLCATPIPSRHAHLFDSTSGRLRCACQACAMVLDRAAASGGRYRRVPDRRRELAALAHDDARWAELGIPVALAFLVRTGDGDALAIFPGALGPTDAPIRADAWAAIERAYPEVGAMESDVEAVLVNRVRGARECWVVPIDVCYRLVALVRARWQGLSGGREVWPEIERFFEQIHTR